MKITQRSRIIMLAVLLLGAGIRSAGISNPLIGHHSWRQADTAAMARNFVTERFNILYPRIDWRGASSGEVECEFPAYQFLLACLYRMFGVRETAGRLLSAAFSLAAIAGLYLLCKRTADRSVGLWAAFFLAVLPLPVYFGRALMPESMLLAACVFAVLLFMRWTESGSSGALYGSALCLALACLIKPPTLYLGLPLAYLAVRRCGLKAAGRPQLWAYAALIFAALGLWYGHAHGIKQATGLTFGVWEYGSDKWGNWDLVSSLSFWERIFIRRIPHVLLSYAGLPLLIAGIFAPSSGSGEGVFSLWYAGMLVFVVIVARGVFVHDYYLLPAAIPTAYYMGKAAAWGLGSSRPHARWIRVGTAVFVVAVFSISLATYRGWLSREDPGDCPALAVAHAARRLIPPRSLVVAVDRGNPLILYYSRLKGWRSYPRDITDEWIAARTAEGARYILGVHDDFDEADLPGRRARLLAEHETLANTDDYFIVTTRGRESDHPRP